MIEIPLTQGRVALIDDGDAHLAALKWRALRAIRRPNVWYAVRTVRGGLAVYLHREVLGLTDPTLDVDHIDGNGLDCRRQNMRVATKGQNQANRGAPKTNTSGYKGVSRDQRCGRWRANIKVRGTQRQIGSFATAEDAARAYDAAALAAWGEFARLNFPTR